MAHPISLTQALAIISQNPLTKHTRDLPIQQALGQCLAEDTHSATNRPFANISAMDGFSVKLSDVKQANTRLNLVGEIAAGTFSNDKLESGQAVRIFTGAPLPEGADHIVIQEHAILDGDHVTCAKAYHAPEYIRPLGEDFRQGDTILTAGHRLRANDLALLAAANLDMVKVWQRPKIAVLTSGLELRPPGSKLAVGQIPNATPYALIPLLESFGADVVDLGSAGDDIDQISAKIEQAGHVDAFVPCGGASVGKHDLTKAAFESVGFSLNFTKVNMRPGKPTWFGSKGQQRVMGLAGNPVSALVCAYVFLGPLLGIDWSKKTVQARLTAPLKDNGPRTHFMRARLNVDNTGTLSVDIFPNQDSGLLSPLALANALVIREANDSAKSVGDLVSTLVIEPIK